MTPPRQKISGPGAIAAAGVVQVPSTTATLLAKRKSITPLSSTSLQSCTKFPHMADTAWQGLSVSHTLIMLP